MHAIEDQILGNPNAAAILRTFFEDFVNGLLIADYKQFKTSNNPYRYRRQISALASDLFHNMDWRAAIARTYIERENGGPAGDVRADGRGTCGQRTQEGKIRQVFEDVDTFMDRIESFRDRLERRVRVTVHYMDMVGESSAERLARVIEKLAASGRDEIEVPLRSPDVGFPITELALYIAPAPRQAPEKTRIKLTERDPYLKSYIAATSEFKSMVRVTPARLKAFIAEKIAERDRILSSGVGDQLVQDLFAFRALPMGVFGAERVVGPYRVIPEEGRTADRVNRPAGFSH